MKSKSSTKPIYSKEVEGAANTVTNAYNQAAPGLQAGANDFGSLRSSILDRYNAGDPALEGARNHYTDVLSGKYLSGNPQLQALIDQTGSDVRNGVAASLGTRGLTGGSDYAGIISRELAKNSTGLRYDDYNNQLGRMDNAASSVGSLYDAENAMLSPAFQSYQAQVAPLLAAQDYGSTIGGLLGQYTKTKQSGSVGQLLGGMAGSALSGWASGGFRGV